MQELAALISQIQLSYTRHWACRETEKWLLSSSPSFLCRISGSCMSVFWEPVHFKCFRFHLYYLFFLSAAIKHLSAWLKIIRRRLYSTLLRSFQHIWYKLCSEKSYIIMELVVLVPCVTNAYSFVTKTKGWSSVHWAIKIIRHLDVKMYT